MVRCYCFRPFGLVSRNTHSDSSWYPLETPRDFIEFLDLCILGCATRGGATRDLSLSGPRPGRHVADQLRLALRGACHEPHGGYERVRVVSAFGCEREHVKLVHRDHDHVLLAGFLDPLPVDRVDTGPLAFDAGPVAHLLDVGASLPFRDRRHELGHGERDALRYLRFAVVQHHHHEHELVGAETDVSSAFVVHNVTVLVLAHHRTPPVIVIPTCIQNHELQTMEYRSQLLPFERNLGRRRGSKN